jgi:6-phosphogluconolactonase
VPQFAYVSAAGSNEIIVLRMDARSGELSAPLQTLSFAAITGRDAKPADSIPFTISPDRRFLYAALRYKPFAYVSFTIDQTTGLLTPIATSPCVHSLSFIATDKSGRFLLGASYQGSLLSINPIDASGVVDDKPSQIIPFKLNSHSVITDPDNRYVYAAILGQDKITGFSFDPAVGRVSARSTFDIPFKPGVGPRHFDFHPTGKFIYSNAEQGGSVHAFRFDTEQHRWIDIQTVSAMDPTFFGTAATADLHITADGRFLYTSERSDDTISGFAIDGDSGILSPLGRFKTEKKPRSFAIDPAGRFLLVVGEYSHHVAICSIDKQSGVLTPRYRYPMGRNPGWVRIVALPD